jgi:hypothetical protein
LTINQAGASPTACTATIATPCQIPSGTSGQFSSQLTTGSQQDWIRFIPTATGNYTIRSSTVPTAHDVYGYLYHASGTALSYNDNDGGNGDFSITATLYAGQTYYIGIRNNSSTTTIQPTYTITINPNLTVTASTLTAAVTGQTVSTTVTTNQASWTARVAPGTSWLTMSKASGISGEAVSVLAEPNTTTNPRNSTITVSAGGKNITLTITQAAATTTP